MKSILNFRACDLINHSKIDLLIKMINNVVRVLEFRISKTHSKGLLERLKNSLLIEMFVSQRFNRWLTNRKNTCIIDLCEG